MIQLEMSISLIVLLKLPKPSSFSSRSPSGPTIALSQSHADQQAEQLERSQGMALGLVESSCLPFARLEPSFRTPGIGYIAANLIARLEAPELRSVACKQCLAALHNLCALACFFDGKLSPSCRDRFMQVRIDVRTCVCAFLCVSCCVRVDVTMCVCMCVPSLALSKGLVACPEIV